MHITTIIKPLISALLLFSCLPSCKAGEPEALNNLYSAAPANISARLPKVPSPTFLPQNKELFSDNNIRYIVKGMMSYDSKPPLLTTETGKVFKVIKHPRWFKLIKPKRVCVEGYVRQREDTDELIIDQLLHPDTLEDLAPSEEILKLQRDAIVMARNASGYTLGNVAWDMTHDAEGGLARDENGNLVTTWQNGVKVDSSLLEDVFFVKKTAIKPLRYGDHGMLMFKFKPGGVTTPDGSSTRSLVVSVDAYYTDPVRMVYSPLAALRGKYQVYYSIQTGERYSDVKFNYNEFNMSTELVLVPHPLLLDAAQKTRLLEAAISKATADNTGEMYSLLYNSCANSVLSLINSVLPDSNKVKVGKLPEIFYRVQTTLPDAAAGLLTRKGIAGAPLPDITRDNFVEYLRW